VIIGIGTDMASIRRIETVLKKHGTRFTERCFADAERARVEQSPKTAKAAGYAKRWAAKEACAKALGLGIRGDIYLKDIIVTNDKQGRPALTLKGGAKKRLSALMPAKMTPHLHVSLSDDGGMALAFVVISATAAKGKRAS
jgi:holo-[acyl-carrier protein] synthase